MRRGAGSVTPAGLVSVSFVENVPPADNLLAELKITTL
jgi:hypothetical protein